MFGPAHPQLRACRRSGTSLSSTPGAGRPILAGVLALPRCAMNANGAVSVEPRPVRNRMRSPQVSIASCCQLVEHVLREAGAGEPQHLQAAEEVAGAAASSARRYGSSASKPLGTLKYQVGAISRRLRTVVVDRARQRLALVDVEACRRCRARGRNCGCRRRCGARAPSRRSPAARPAKKASAVRIISWFEHTCAGC